MGGKYTPSHDSIVGILEEMNKTLTADYEPATEKEDTAKTDFLDLMKLKQESIDQEHEKVRKKTKEKAEAQVTLAQTVQNYDDTDSQMKADIEFFDITKEACTNKSVEWTDRKALRKEELEGVEKALEILSTDDARELFNKAIKPGVQSFLQVSAVESKGPQRVSATLQTPAQRAYEAIKKQAQRSHNLRLAQIAVSIGMAKEGHFTKVIESIDNLVETLKEEGEADIEK